MSRPKPSAIWLSRRRGAAPFSPKVKGYVTHISDEIDFVGVQLKWVSVIPPRDSVAHRFPVAHLQESLNQLVCMKQSGVDLVVSRSGERQHLDRYRVAAVLAEGGQQGQHMDQIVIDPVGVVPQVLEQSYEEITGFTAVVQGNGLFAERAVMPSSEGFVPA